MENSIMRVIGIKYGFNPGDNRVKEADNILIATEARDLMDNTECWDKLPEPLIKRIIPMKNTIAEDIFLEVAKKLIDRRESE